MCDIPNRRAKLLFFRLVFSAFMFGIFVLTTAMFGRAVNFAFFHPA